MYCNASCFDNTVWHVKVEELAAFVESRDGRLFRNVYKVKLLCLLSRKTVILSSIVVRISDFVLLFHAFTSKLLNGIFTSDFYFQNINIYLFYKNFVQAKVLTSLTCMCFILAVQLVHLTTLIPLYRRMLKSCAHQPNIKVCNENTA